MQLWSEIVWIKKIRLRSFTTTYWSLVKLGTYHDGFAFWERNLWKSRCSWTRMMDLGESNREWLFSQSLNGWEWLTDGNWPLSHPMQWLRIDGILIKGPLVGTLDGNWSLLFTAQGDIWFMALVVFGFCVSMEDLENPVQESDVGWYPWLWWWRWKIPRSSLILKDGFEVFWQRNTVYSSVENPIQVWLWGLVDS